MKFLTTYIGELKSYDERREGIIKSSRDILKAAKQVIFFCHEGSIDAAEKQYAIASDLINKALKKYDKPLSKNRSFDIFAEGSWSAAIEEYLEAWYVLSFLKFKKVKDCDVVRAPAHVVIGALSDFTGEVARLAVMKGSDKDIKGLEKMRDVCAEVIASLLPLYLTGQSRQKFDQAKRNLKRIEEIVYEVKLRA